jgi:phage host-nuclease inhibitor protein Gam
MMKRIGELNKENAHLKAEVERLTAFTTRTIIPNEELQAEVKRLQIEVAEWQESYHLVNERMAQILKQGRGL